MEPLSEHIDGMDHRHHTLSLLDDKLGRSEFASGSSPCGSKIHVFYIGDLAAIILASYELGTDQARQRQAYLW